MSLSVKFNGIELNQYIDVLQGFTPFGGSDWEPELLSSGGMRRGTDFAYTTYKQKTIPMPFTMLENIQSKYDELERILNVDEPKPLVFDNAPGRVFYAIPMNDLEFDDYECFGEGTITWLIPDGLAHSTVEKTFRASVNSDGILEATIVNKGTESVPISYEITHNHENGYIGIVSEHGAMQYGFVDESDGETYKQNEMLVTHDDFFNAPDDHTGLDGMHPTYGSSGTLAIHTWFNTRFLAMDSIGTKTGTYNGGKRTVTIPADSEGNIGAKNFYCYMHMIMYAGLMGQTGELSVSFLTEDDEFICGYCWYKNDTSGNTGHFELNVHDPNKSASDMFRYRTLKNYSFTTSHLHSQNPWYWDWGHVDIRKEGSKLTFYYWGGYPSYIVPEVEDMVCAKIQIAIRQRTNSNKYLTYLGLNNLSFKKINVEKWRDVPNRYQEGDILTFDGESGKFYVNGMIKQEDRRRGSIPFQAPPGETKVQFYYSDFCDPVPTAKATIREAWL